MNKVFVLLKNLESDSTLVVQLEKSTDGTVAERFLVELYYRDLLDYLLDSTTTNPSKVSEYEITSTNELKEMVRNRFADSKQSPSNIVERLEEIL